MIDIPERDSRILEFIAKHKIRNSNGSLFEWDNHYFLLEPLCDFHPRQGIGKCSQVGFSEMEIIKAFFLAGFYKLNVLYTLPTDSFVLDFVPPKVNKIIENNPVFQKSIKGNTHQKEIGRGFGKRIIYFKGANSSESIDKKAESSAGVSITSDINIHDEASKSDTAILNQMRSRYQNSHYKGRWLFDNPTFPKVGADAIYQQSDQKRWHVQCPRCNYWQYLDWFRLDKLQFETGTEHCFIDVENKVIRCGKCLKEIDNNARKYGEWVAKYPSITKYRGYHINQLAYVQHSVEDILLQEEDTSVGKDYFYNMILGKPYIGTDVKLSRADIIQNLSTEPNNKLRNYMGIDQGRIKYYVIGNKTGIFKIGKTESWLEIEKEIEKYEPIVVSDALPAQAEPKRLASKFEGNFFRAFYKTESLQSELAKFSPKSNPDTVLIKRNETFDQVVDLILAHNFMIQVPINELDEYISHWESIHRVISEDAFGNQRFEWIRVSDDHYAHATVYFYTAMQKDHIGEITSIQPKKKTDIFSTKSIQEGMPLQIILDEFKNKK